MALSKKNHHIANTKNSVVRSILNKISSDIELLTPDIEKNILKHFKNKCAYTGKTLVKKQIHFDHLIPCNKEYGGLYLPGNLVPTSSDINIKKGGKNFKEFINNSDLFSSAEKEKKIKELENYQNIFKYPTDLINAKFIENLSEIYSEIDSLLNTYVLKLLYENSNEKLNNEINLDYQTEDKLSKNFETNEIFKVYRKIPNWFKNESQKNSKILITFLKLNVEGQKITVEKLKEKVKIDNFDSNFKNMSEIYSKNHAKVFQLLKNGEVVLWKDVEKFILQEFKKFKQEK